MLFSCKISSAILAYLEQEGEDLQVLLDATHLPEEFLRDPSFWIKASEMEDFLKSAIQIFRTDQQFLQKVGHAGPELRSWGVLDSVLRMMPRPSEIFNQPQRFLSYFISPEPPIENVINTESGVQLDLPVSSEMFPFVTTYLRHAFESLPLYIGQELGVCHWEDIHLKIIWANDQKTFFSEDPGRQISPELLRSIVASLEKHQRELEAKNKELQEKNDKLTRAHEESMTQFAQKFSRDGGSESFLLSDTSAGEANLTSASLEKKGGMKDCPDLLGGTSLEILQNNFSKMADYMVRAQQLVTLIVGQDRMKPGIKEAIRRTDWEVIKITFPQIVRQSQDILRHSVRRSQDSQANGSGMNSAREANVLKSREIDSIN